MMMTKDIFIDRRIRYPLSEIIEVGYPTSAGYVPPEVLYGSEWDKMISKVIDHMSRNLELAMSEIMRCR
jgi:hypothetical protein